MKNFNEVKNLHLEKLELYVPVVERVHGGSHPEFYDVRKVYDKIITKVNDAGVNKPKLDDEFKQLREITSDYRIPSDVCETYEAVYNMLAELDEAYQG